MVGRVEDGGEVRRGGWERLEGECVGGVGGGVGAGCEVSTPSTALKQNMHRPELLEVKLFCGRFLAGVREETHGRQTGSLFLKKRSTQQMHFSCWNAILERKHAGRYFFPSTSKGLALGSVDSVQWFRVKPCQCLLLHRYRCMFRG